jgi:lipopolysaccharide transport system permease protein
MSQNAHANVTIYKPNFRHEHGLLTTWFIMARNIVNSRDLIWQLFRRDFVAGYKKSFFGYVWRFVAPIAGIVPWVILQRTRLLDPGHMEIPFPAYVLMGTTMWGLFRGFYGSAHSTLAAGGGLIQQVNYPHEALLVKQIASHLAGFLTTFAVSLAVLMAFKVMPSWKIVFFPLVALPLFFLGASVGLIFSMISVVAVDVDKAMNYAMGLLVWTMPIIYSQEVESRTLQAIIKWNPLTYLVCSARDIVVFGRLYEPSVFYACAAGTFVLFLISWRLFYVSEGKVIERMI